MLRWSHERNDLSSPPSLHATDRLRSDVTIATNKKDAFSAIGFRQINHLNTRIFFWVIWETHFITYNDKEEKCRHQTWGNIIYLLNHTNVHDLVSCLIFCIFVLENKCNASTTRYLKNSCRCVNKIWLQYVHARPPDLTRLRYGQDSVMIYTPVRTLGCRALAGVTCVTQDKQTASKSRKPKTKESCVFRCRNDKQKVTQAWLCFEKLRGVRGGWLGGKETLQDQI